MLPEDTDSLDHSLQFCCTVQHFWKSQLRSLLASPFEGHSDDEPRLRVGPDAGSRVHSAFRTAPFLRMSEGRGVGLIGRRGCKKTCQMSVAYIAKYTFVFPTSSRLVLTSVPQLSFIRSLEKTQSRPSICILVAHKIHSSVFLFSSVLQ